MGEGVGFEGFEGFEGQIIAKPQENQAFLIFYMFSDMKIIAKPKENLVFLVFQTMAEIGKTLIFLCFCNVDVVSLFFILLN